MHRRPVILDWSVDGKLGVSHDSSNFSQGIPLYLLIQHLSGLLEERLRHTYEIK